MKTIRPTYLLAGLLLAAGALCRPAGAQAPAPQLRSTTKVITTGQVLALNATPIALVAAPGAGKALIFEGITVYKPAGTAYGGIASGEDLAVRYTDGSGTVLATIETTGFLDQTTAQTRFARAYAAASGVNDITPTANAALVAHLLSGEITTGTSALRTRVLYRVVPTAP